MKARMCERIQAPVAHGQASSMTMAAYLRQRKSACTWSLNLAHYLALPGGIKT